MIEQWATLRRKIHPETLLQVPAVASWFRSKRSRLPILYELDSYVRWRKAHSLSDSPAEWIKECVEGRTSDLVRHAIAIRDWAEDYPGLRKDSRSKYMQDVRGFFLHSMVQLPPTKIASPADPDEVSTQVTATEYLKMLERVLASRAVGVRDTSIIMTLAQSGMDESTTAKVFNVYAFGQLTERLGVDPSSWDPSQAPVRIDLTRPKTNYRYYTFLGHDAILLLKDWLALRAKKFGGPLQLYPRKQPKSLPLSDPIYVTKYGKAMDPGNISTVFREAGRAVGINVSPGKVERYRGATIRYPLHGHQVRDTLITLRQRCGVDRAVVDFFCGHKFDEDEYDSPWDNPDLFRQEYLKLAPHLDLITVSETRMKARLKEKYDTDLEAELSKRDAQYEELRADFERIKELLKKGAKIDPQRLDME